MIMRDWSMQKIIGMVFMITGAYLLIVSTGTIPMSVVSFGPISISGLPEQKASTIFVGIVLIVLGYGIFNGFNKLTRLFR